MNERKRRSIAKSLSWRVAGTTDTILISYFLTGSIKIATSIGSIELISKMALFYAHERAWQKFKWGLN